MDLGAVLGSNIKKSGRVKGSLVTLCQSKDKVLSPLP